MIHMKYQALFLTKFYNKKKNRKRKKKKKKTKMSSAAVLISTLGVKISW